MGSAREISVSKKESLNCLASLRGRRYKGKGNGGNQARLSVRASREIPLPFPLLAHATQARI